MKLQGLGTGMHNRLVVQIRIWGRNMQPQIAFLLRPEFQQFMAGLTNLETAQELIHGVFIDIHPVWESLVYAERLVGQTSNPGYPLPYPDVEWDGTNDFDWVPGGWERLCKNAGKILNPFLVRLQILPGIADTLPQRRAIQAYASSQSFFVAVVEEELAVLATNIEGGLDVTATGPGTLGGFLSDSNVRGSIWGTTCGHVAQTSPANFALPDVNGVAIANAGTVRYSNFNSLMPSPRQGVCNQYVNQAHPSVDAALVELAAGHTGLNSVKSIGRVDQIFTRTQLNSRNRISMTGAVSGTHDYKIGGYGVTAKIGLAGSPLRYCFSHLFDFSASGRSPSWMPGRIAQAGAPRPLRGDSGAWLCFDHSGSGNAFAFFGTLIAVRGAVGIATFADSLISWAASLPGQPALVPI